MVVSVEYDAVILKIKEVLLLRSNVGSSADPPPNETPVTGGSYFLKQTTI